MKALSLIQPMAWAIFHGKDVENRTWKTAYRGPLLIHASRGYDPSYYRFIVNNENRLVTSIPDEYSGEFIHGAFLGTVNLVGVLRKVDVDEIKIVGKSSHEVERAMCSRWFSGPYGFVLTEPREFKRPIFYRGMPGIFTVPDEVIKDAEYPEASGGCPIDRGPGGLHLMMQDLNGLL